MQALRKVNHNIQSWFGRGNRLNCVWNVTSCLVSQMRSQFELWSSRTGRVESRCIIFVIYLFFFLRHSQANIREMASVFICQWLRPFWAWKISLVMQATLKRSLHCCEKSTCVTFQCPFDVDACAIWEVEYVAISRECNVHYLTCQGLVYFEGHAYEPLVEAFEIVLAIYLRCNRKFDEHTRGQPLRLCFSVCNSPSR